MRRTDLFTVSGFTTVTSSCDECLGDTIETESLGLPPSAFLLELVYDKVTLTTEFLYRLCLGAELGDIGRMRRRESNDLATQYLAEEFIRTDMVRMAPFPAAPSLLQKYSF
jgi:hypothetical protein